MSSDFTSKEKALETVRRDGLMVMNAPEKYKDDYDVAYAAVSDMPLAYEHISDAMKANETIAMKAVSVIGRVLAYAPEAIRDNRDVVLQAVMQDGSAFEFASERLRKDRDLALTAMEEASGENADDAFDFVDPSLIDHDFIEEAVSKNGFVISHVPKEYMTYHLADLAINQTGFALGALPEPYRNDRSLVLKAVSYNGNVIEFVPKEFLFDEEVVKTALMKNPEASFFLLDPKRPD